MLPRVALLSMDQAPMQAGTAALQLPAMPSAADSSLVRSHAEVRSRDEDAFCSHPGTSLSPGYASCCWGLAPVLSLRLASFAREQIPTPSDECKLCISCQPMHAAF